MWVLFQIVAIHEDVLCSRVTMQITIEHDLTFLHECSNQSLYSKVLWMHGFIWSLPTTIEILTTKRAPVVAINYTVRVENRHNLEDKVISKRSGFRSVTNEVINYTLHHP